MNMVLWSDARDRDWVALGWKRTVPDPAGSTHILALHFPRNGLATLFAPDEFDVICQRLTQGKEVPVTIEAKLRKACDDA